MVTWLNDREVLQLSCRNSRQSSRLPLYYYWAKKIKFVFVCVTIQQSPELREWFRHGYFLSRFLQPSWLGFCGVAFALHHALIRRTESGKIQLTIAIVFSNICASSTTSTLIWLCCRRSTAFRCAGSSGRSRQAKSSINTAASSTVPPHFARTGRSYSRATQPCIPYL